MKVQMSKARLKYCLQRILKEYEDEICYVHSFYNFGTCSNIWDNIVNELKTEIDEYIGYQILKVSDN